VEDKVQLVQMYLQLQMMVAIIDFGHYQLMLEREKLSLLV
jgi:hypothetical protein